MSKGQQRQRIVPAANLVPVSSRHVTPTDWTGAYRWRHTRLAHTPQGTSGDAEKGPLRSLSVAERRAGLRGLSGMLMSPKLGIAFKSAGQDSLSGCERESWLSLAIRSKDSLFDLIRYWNWPSSGGRRRTISYCCPTVGTPSRGGAKLTNCPTLNLWVAMFLSGGVACKHLTV